MPHFQRSAKLIVVASEAYFASRWTEEEWTSAFYLRRGAVIPVCVERITLPGLLGPVVRIDLSDLTEDQARERLLSGLAPRNGRGAPAVFPGPLTPSFPPAIRSNANVPSRDPEFRGREAELSRIADAFSSGKIAAVTGIPGVGKTALATEHFYRQASSHSVAWWITAHDSELVIRDLAEIAAELRLPASDQPNEAVAAGAALEWLDTNGGWLLVLDDVQAYQDISQLTALSRGSVLVTTSNLGLGIPGEIIELAPWERSDSLAYVGAVVKESQGVDDLAAALGDLPLAVSQARSYMAAAGLSPSQYLDLFLGRQAELLERGDPGGHKTTLTAHVGLAISHLSDDARALLLISSAFAPELLPIEVFRTAMEFPELLPGQLADEVGLEDAIAELRRVSLVRREGPFLSMHGLIQQVSLAVVDRSERMLAVARASGILASATPEWTARPQNWAQCERILPHVLAVIEHLEANSDMPEASAWLLNRMGIYVEARGDQELAVEMLERALSFAEQSGNLVTVGSVLNNLGNAIAGAGDLRRGTELVERALIEKRAGGARPMILARTVGALGSLARRQGEFQKAIELHREALQLLEQDPEVEEELLAEERNDIGICAVELGRLDDALTMHTEALSIYERVLGTDALEVGQTLSHLAVLQHELGNDQAALNFQKRALEIYESHLSTDHPDLASLLSELGLILTSLGRFDDALEALKRAEEIVSAKLPKEHYRHGHILGNLGNVLLELGRPEEAVDAHKRSLMVLESLGSSHPSVIRQKGNLATTLSVQRESAEAFALWHDAITALAATPFGSLHVQIADAYTYELKERGDDTELERVLDILFDCIARVDSRVRREAYGWLAALSLRIGDMDRFRLSVQKQQEATP